MEKSESHSPAAIGWCNTEILFMKTVTCDFYSLHPGTYQDYAMNLIMFDDRFPPRSSNPNMRCIRVRVRDVHPSSQGMIITVGNGKRREFLLKLRRRKTKRSKE